MSSADFNRKWVSDNLMLMETNTGVKLYGTVCTDISFIANQLNENEAQLNKLTKENNCLKEENNVLNDLNNHELEAYQEKVRDLLDEKINQYHNHHEINELLKELKQELIE